MTKERIRQIIASAEKRLAGSADRVRFVHWKSACSSAKIGLPRPVSSFLECFGYKSLNSANATYKMIERCSNIFGLDYPFEKWSLRGVGTFVFNRGSDSTIRALAKLPSAAEGPYSCLTDVARSLAIGEQTLARAIDGSRSWEFLEEKRQYFWRPPPLLPPTRYRKTGNAVLTALCKIFSVITHARTSDLSLSVARDRILRKFGTQEVPAPALEGISDRSGLFEVRQGEIARKEGLDWCVIGRRDLALLRICVERGRVVSSDVLYSELLGKGFSREYANQILVHSPLLVHTLSGAWEQRGIYKFVPRPEQIDLSRLAEHVKKNHDYLDMDSDYSDDLVTIPISARTIISGQYFGLDAADVEGFWDVHDSSGDPVGQITISDRGVSGLESVISTLGLEKGDVLRLRIKTKAGKRILVSVT